MVFFITSAVKFFHGGFVAVLMALAILTITGIWHKGNEIKEKATVAVDIRDYVGQIEALSSDESFPVTQANVVFLVPQMENHMIGRQFIYSILDKRPKRAHAYWFVNVEVTDKPYTKEFEIDTLGTDCIIMVKFYLGFRVQQEVNVYLRQVIYDLTKDGRIPKQPQRYSITPGCDIGDLQFVIIQEALSSTTDLTRIDKQIMQMKLFIKRHPLSLDHWFGLEYSEVTFETIPLFIGEIRKTRLTERSHTHPF